MFSPNSTKFFCALVFVLSFSSCGWWRAKNEKPVEPKASTADELKSEIPFSTGEPEVYQAEFVVTANNRETKTFVARAGDNRRFDYNAGAKNQLTVVRIGAERSFLILPEKKIYADEPADFAATGATRAGDNFNDFLTAEWLNAKADAEFTILGAENGLTKYAVKLNDSDAAETIIFVDEKINLPVRQEFYGKEVGGEQKNLTYTFEMRNFKTETPNDLFEIPKNYKKVSPENLRSARREIKIDD